LFTLKIMEYLTNNKNNFKIIGDKQAPILNLILINKLIIIILIVLSGFFFSSLYKDFEEIFEPLNVNLVKSNEFFLSNNFKHSNSQFRFKIKKEKNNKVDIPSKITFNVTKIKYSADIKNNINIIQLTFNNVQDDFLLQL